MEREVIGAFIALIACVLFFGRIFYLVVKRGETWKSSLLFFSYGIFGIVMFIIVALSPWSLNTERKLAYGQPRTEIAAGPYKVGFVYEAGDRVSVGIEKEDEKGSGQREHLFFYQFPAGAFAGPVDTAAKKLVVTESGGFKKLELLK